MISRSGISKPSRPDWKKNSCPVAGSSVVPSSDSKASPLESAKSLTVPVPGVGSTGNARIGIYAPLPEHRIKRLFVTLLFDDLPSYRLRVVAELAAVDGHPAAKH